MKPFDYTFCKRRWDAIHGLRLSVLLVSAVLLMTPLLLLVTFFSEGEVRLSVKILVVTFSSVLPVLAMLSIISSSRRVIGVINELSNEASK